MTALNNLEEDEVFWCSFTKKKKKAIQTKKDLSELCKSSILFRGPGSSNFPLKLVIRELLLFIIKNKKNDFYAKKVLKLSPERHHELTRQLSGAATVENPHSSA